MKLFIGLGNPGKKYQDNRHNVGHMVIARLPKDKQFQVTDTYMNHSGIFVQRQVRFYKLELTNLYIIHDDLDLPVGEYRLQFDRGPAGHHGVESIIEHLHSQSFWRFRIGIGHPVDQTPLEKYVLQPFSGEEKMLIDEVVDKIANQILSL